MSGNHYRLDRSLLLANASLNGQVHALSNGSDPLRLNLPPLLDDSAGMMPSASMLHAMAAIYLQAELEQTGIVVVAEALAQMRASLGLRSRTAAQKLEDFARQQRDWYDREQRHQLFVRLFGIGDITPESRGFEVNRDFQQRFASLSTRLLQYAEDYRWGQQPGPARETTLRHAAKAVLFNLGPRQYGNTVIAGRKIQEQLQAAIGILQDRDIAGLFLGRGLWDTLRKILGDQTPDLGRLNARGQSGQRLLTWLALALPELRQSTPTRPLLPARSPAFVWAAAWLQATGMQVRTARSGG